MQVSGRQKDCAEARNAEGGEILNKIEVIL